MNKQEFISRRNALLAQMAPASAAIIFSAPEAQRNADCEYPYRQHSDFLYLTGFSEPEAVLVLIKVTRNIATPYYSTVFAISQQKFGLGVD